MTDLQIEPATRRAVKQEAALLGIGTATPAPVLQSEAIKIAEEIACETDGQRAWLRRVFTRSGVESRGCVLEDGKSGVRDFFPSPAEIGPRGPTIAARMARYAIEAPKLLEQSARIALEEANLAPDDITHIITVSCTGFFAPGLDVQAITRLHLRPDIRRTQIGFMGCHAAFNALATARDAVRADPAARVLVCCVELSTLHFAYGWQPEKLVANALFADGAAACIVGAASSDVDAWTLRHSASMLLPESQNAMTWNIGDHGFEMTLSAELPALISAHAKSWCEAWLGKNNLTIADIHKWAIHPGGPKILGAVRDALLLCDSDLRASSEILARHGNMSSATVLFILKKLAEEATGGQHCVALGFGPGLMMEGMLLKRGAILG